MDQISKPPSFTESGPAPSTGEVNQVVRYAATYARYGSEMRWAFLLTGLCFTGIAGWNDVDAIRKGEQSVPLRALGAASLVGGIALSIEWHRRQTIAQLRAYADAHPKMVDAAFGELIPPVGKDEKRNRSRERFAKVIGSIKRRLLQPRKLRGRE
jgi:hypothetical protein